ncbi:hypothetical protein Lpp120_1266 [Lacticaseibacillus paracasei subsp. paracasei Lpp120]|nr:hypothetical protein Lpp120_1266 [Lacticaseibacillus paracasei subsp. paracasei Lpp120]
MSNNLYGHFHNFSFKNTNYFHKTVDDISVQAYPKKELS